MLQDPKCKICGIDLTHDWLDGDYSLLLCDKKDCWDELSKTYKKTLNLL